MLSELLFNNKWNTLMKEIENNGEVCDRRRFLQIETYNVLRYKSKFSKDGYDFLFCWPSHLMRDWKKKDRIIIMKRELFSYCKNGWDKEEQLKLYFKNIVEEAKRMKIKDNSAEMHYFDETEKVFEEDGEYLNYNRDEFLNLYREQACIKVLVKYLMEYC